VNYQEYQLELLMLFVAVVVVADYSMHWLVVVDD
jgi:hypothetical protein